jgi:hypothetical protein
MATRIRRVGYFHATVKDEPGQGYQLLSVLAELGVSLLAFTAIPVGPMHTQLTIFPGDAPKLASEAAKAGLMLDGPHPAFLVQGDDELGVLASLHETLYEARINVFASTGVAGGRGDYGYILYVRAEDFERAAEILGV